MKDMMDDQASTVTDNLTQIKVTLATPKDSINNYADLEIIRQRLLYVVLPVIVLIGTIGNGLAFRVLMRRRMRSKSVYFYLAVLACADTMVLYVSAFRFWLRMLTGFEIMHVSNLSCKLVIFLIISSQHVSAWMVVLVTADRFLSIWRPFHAASLCTVRRARIITLLSTAIIAAYSAHIFWTFSLIYKNDRTPMCTIDSKSHLFFLFDYVKTVTYCLLPSLVVLILNSCIIYKVSTRRRQLDTREGRCLTRNVVNNRGMVEKRNRVTTMLLVISFVWLGLTTPYGILAIFRTYFINADRVLMNFIRTVIFLMFYLNHSVNFYLYCLTGQKIRTEFCNMFLSLCDSRRRNIARQRSTQRTPVANDLHEHRELGDLRAPVELDTARPKPTVRVTI